MEPKIENALPAGHLLRHYRVAKTLGGGGFSIVYLAYDTINQRSVVIKEYLPSKQARRGDSATVESLSAETSVTFKQGIERFFDEAAALAKVNHPSIVRVVDFFRDNNTVYLVMNHEQGKDLRWYLKRHGGRLSEKFIRTVFPPLLLGLRELHSHNLLHLDVKPANVFLRPGGNPMLIDFGAAQPAYADNRVLGAHTLTPGYAPVEQHRRGHLGPWTDIYAVGATMWTCMSGKSPPPALARAEKDKYKPAVRQFARHYSRPLLEAVDWCLQMDQLARPQTVQELLEVLDRIGDEPVGPEPGLFTRLLALAKK
ncbi:MAG: serine/threonine protein kinase [Gammaproteobacteria bacterium]